MCNKAKHRVEQILKRLEEIRLECEYTDYLHACDIVRHYLSGVPNDRDDYGTR